MDTRLNARWLGALSLLMALMPLSFSVSSHIKALPALLLLIAGIGVLLSSKAARQSYRNAWPVMVICAVAVIYTALNIICHGLGWAEFDLPSHIILYMLTAAVFSLPLRLRWVWMGFSLTAIALGMVCIVQHHVLGIDRAYGLNGGDWGAIEFAMVMLVLSLVGWLQLFYSNTGMAEKALHGVGAVFGMYGALLTQSRGPLLAFAPVLLLLLLIHTRRKRSWLRDLLIFVLIVCGGLLGAASVHNNSTATLSTEPVPPPPALVDKPHATSAPAKVATTGAPVAAPVVAAPLAADPVGSTAVYVKRFADVGSEITSYNSKTDATGAVRERLEMWHIAGHAFMDHPMAGVGIDQFGVYARRQVAAGQANVAIAKYEHPHNEYLEAAATGGAPSLLITLLLFAVPLGYFIRHALHASDGGIITACVGVATVSMYALCGLTDNVFYRAMPHSMYFFLVLGLSVCLASPNHPESSTEASRSV